MVFVDFAQKDGVLSLSVDGHALTGPEGHDLVCSAVSALSYTLGYGLRKMHKDGKMIGDVCVSHEPGASVLTCKPKPEYLKEARIEYGLVLHGFFGLHLTHPNAVTIASIEDEEEERIISVEVKETEKKEE
ncbi:MAG: ribosomal-processing cysteine protease Prp [Oscillospiraceae bacterium]|nr:ribosomal-processing cysteine protease Prp [Oscillospiraceae bacterium]